MNSFISFYLNYSTYIYNFLQLKILSLDKLRIYLFNLIFQFCFRINIFYYSARFYCNKFNTIFDNFIWNFLLFSNFSTVVNKNKIYYLYYQLIDYLKGKNELKRETTWWIFGEKSTDRNCGHERSTTMNRCTPVSCSVVCEAYKRKIEGFAAAPVEALYRGYQR